MSALEGEYDVIVYNLKHTFSRKISVMEDVKGKELIDDDAPIENKNVSDETEVHKQPSSESEVDFRKLFLCYVVKSFRLRERSCESFSVLFWLLAIDYDEVW